MSTGAEKRETLQQLQKEYTEKALLYIHHNYAKAITVNKLSAHVGLCRGHFRRVFREFVHMNPMDYIMWYRMEKAKELLLITELSVAEVGHSCGFTAISNFCAKFKRATGYSPQQYRSREKER